MFEIEKKKLKIELLISSIIILLIAIIMTLCDSCRSDIINIFGSKDRSLILRTIIQTVGLFLGFIITAIVMRFNQLDSRIQKIGEELNAIRTNNPLYGNHEIVQRRIEQLFNNYLATNPQDEAIKRQILTKFSDLYKYRAHHMWWFKYPLYYSLITLLITFLLFVFQETLSNNQSVYILLFSLCCLMAIWVVYINITFVLEFLENAFKRQ